MYELVRYFAQGEGQAYVNEKWCVNKKAHFYRRAAYLPFGGGWQTLQVKPLGPCDGTSCSQFSTSNGQETRTEPLDPEMVMRFASRSELDPDFQDYL